MTQDGRGLLERLADGPILGDGGYLLELERRGWVQAGPFTPEVSITHPEALVELHREFAAAGSEILQALTFYASEEKLATVGLAGRVDDINRAAVAIANQVADEVADGGRERPLVAGGLSPTWVYENGDAAAAQRVADLFDQQLDVQVAGGVDLVICETFTSLGEATIAVERAKQTGRPVVATLGFHRGLHTDEGISAADAAAGLLDAGADVIGVNCLRDPSGSLLVLSEMKAAVPDARLACQPVGYHTTLAEPNFSARPEFPFALESIALTRGEMAAYALAAKEMGVGLIGSCCGSVAIHVRAMAVALGKLEDTERRWRAEHGRPMSAVERHRA
ncbi:MAG TPA: homocysteine S-methyltransferase family protein [Candidatus Limnocylindrales bacterium]|nr:homocysteine S-methyltransferase family protein [Candidatus Limnocylindrales bacterium]